MSLPPSDDLHVTRTTIVQKQSLVTKLADKVDVLSGFLRDALSAETRSLLDSFTTDSKVSHTLESALVRDLNQVIDQGGLCSREITQRLLLPDYITRLLSEHPNDTTRSKITRHILDLVFSHELVEESNNKYDLQRAGHGAHYESYARYRTKPLSAPGSQATHERETLELVVILEKNYLDWEKNYVVQISPSTAAPSGGSFTDIEERANTSARPEAFTVVVDADIPFREAHKQIIDNVWRRTQAYAKDPDRPVPYDKLWLRSPSGVETDDDHTLRELGFQSHDELVLEWEKLPLLIATGRLHPRELPKDLSSFFEAVVPDLQTARSLEDWDGEYNPSQVGGLALYTEEDSEIARYVRQHYAALHFMSGFDLTLYFLEYIPPIGTKERQGTRSFWRKRLPGSWLESWNALGLLRSKPFPAGVVYDIARDIDIQPAELPCLVLFNHWTKMKYERLIRRIDQPPHMFFRRVCTDVHKAVDTQGKKDVHAFSFSTFVADLSQSPSVVRLAASGESHDSPASTECGRTKVFLCHSSIDKDFVQRLALDLRKLGLNVWFDKWEIRVGDSLLEKIEHGVKTNDYLLIVLSPDAVQSPWVRLELNAAMMRELEDLKVRVLPVLFRQTEVPLLIRDKLYADFTRSYDDGFRTLVERLAPDATESVPIVRSVSTEPPPG